MNQSDITQSLTGYSDFVHQALQDFNVPGAGVAIVANGEIAYIEGFGYRDIEAKKLITADTLFAICSTTKAMSATLIGMFVDEGKLAWDTPLRHYLPTFRLSDPIISERVTLRDLLTHRSGLARHDALGRMNRLT